MTTLILEFKFEFQNLIVRNRFQIYKRSLKGGPNKDDRKLNKIKILFNLGERKMPFSQIPPRNPRILAKSSGSALIDDSLD